ncbi:MAG TPA: DUF4097 family beta strand repeat-containing protein [Pyrinomonadaceae bacterium]|nr:hypothetical protein [Chloracidobacterium sp.]HQX56306.1 DUF4097 family beta strand repeat-containing protein [Pyrinomonadaceae bacterium]MBK7803035.1 hypothetical protein [Chloracidobacterium sp.]MBL0240800.1 hypothetical protein [Chloracidobacterium sp.]HQY66048.1 DUF4097 family beta strand repeat-containing protein [Pyrinomonadaceae bacterium]
MTASGRKLIYGVVLVGSLLAFSLLVAGQAAPAPPATPAPFPKKPVELPVTPPSSTGSVERSMKVDPALNLSLCVSEASLKVNSWNRNELRVFVRDGSDFEFKTQQTSPKTGEPVWILINAVNSRSKLNTRSECINGGEIEIDLPANASVNVKGQEVTSNIDGVRKVSVKIIAGNTFIRNVTEGITVSGGQGGIAVENSYGAMSLDSTTGNIVVFEAGPSDIGDTFRAKTNGGAISLEKISHRQLEVNSISGSVNYSGTLLKGGSYSFGTSNGSIRLALPQDTSCTVSATYGFGKFNSDLPVETLTENISEGPVKITVGRIGSGDAILRVTTINGSISIKKP